MKRIISFGETLIRFDVEPTGDMQMFPTGTALNFLTNISRLGGVEPILASALSNKKDSEIVVRHLKEHDIVNNTFIANENPLGSYLMFKTSSIFSWEVVYNRKETSWLEFTKSNETLLKDIKKDDFLHLDGISLCSSKQSLDKTISEVDKAKKIGATIVFDFNFRKTLNASDNVEEAFEDIIKKSDYLNISYYDLMKLLNVKELTKDSLKQVQERFGNIKKIFGTKKETFPDKGLGISGFEIIDGDIKFTDVKKYTPKELIGQGDSFAAFVVHGLITENKFNIDKAVDWSIYKTQFLGDSTVPTLKEYQNYKKGINVIR